MRESIWNKKIPTLFGLIMLVIGVAVTSYLTRNGVIFTSQASPAHTPENIRITNISDTSVSISYITADTVPGIVAYGTDSNLSQTAVDDRNQQIDSLTPYTIHHITLKNLNPGTKYFFSITSGPDTFLKDGALFEVTTGPKINTPPTSKSPVSGKVITSNGTPPTEAIVYITTDDGQTLSTLTKKDGTYTVPINSMRTRSLTSYVTFTDITIIKLLAVGDTHQSNVTVLSKQINPVPTVTLSLDYDFTTSIAPVASSSAQIGFPSFTATTSNSPEPRIITPKKDEEFRDQRPSFRGSAQPNTNVTITIHSDEQIEEKVTTDSRGNWVYRPTKPLSPGPHTITATTRDQFGILKTITQSFTVLASGSQVNQSATPSATPTLRITATPTQRPSPTPTKIAGTTPSPTLMVQLTATPSPTLVLVTAAITQPPGPTGDVIAAPGTSSTVIGLGAIATTISGILLFFLSNGISL